MTETIANCPQCGAKPRERSRSTCEFCGFEFPAATAAGASGVSKAEIESRLRAIEESARFASLADHDARQPISAASVVLPLLFLILWITMGSFVIYLFNSFSPLAALFPLCIVGFGAFAVLRGVTRQFRVNDAALKRRAAIVLDKRTQISGAEQPATSYFVTLVSRAGERQEFSVDGQLYGTLTGTDAGVAFTRAEYLLEFQRIDL